MFDGLFRPRNTVQSVARTLAEGLEDGSITLGPGTKSSSLNEAELSSSLRRLVEPRHTASDVAQRLVEGLDDGSITLGDSNRD